MKQKVLTIPSELVAKIYHRDGFFSDSRTINSVKTLIKKHGEFVDRDWAESTNSVKQIIACSIIRNDGKILCMRRTKKSSRSALRLRWTVVMGGHVDQEDQGVDQPILNCLLRELEEELGIIPSTKPKLLGIVVDPATPVGRLHLGMVYDVRIPQSSVSLSPNNDLQEFVRIHKKTNIKMVDAHNINPELQKFDPWSYLFLSSKAALNLFKNMPHFKKEPSFHFSWP